MLKGYAVGAIVEGGPARRANGHIYRSPGVSPLELETHTNRLGTSGLVHDEHDGD